MSRPSKPDQHRRRRVRNIRFSDAEHALIEQRAKVEHLSFTDFVRKAALERAESDHSPKN